MSHECLDRVVSSLGDAAAEPTLEQLASVIESLDREVDPPAVIATMLAVAAASGVPAAAHCRELLENSELRVPELSVVAAKKLLTPRATDDAIRQERRERRQREREARQRAAKTPPPSRHRSANPPPAKETAVPVNKVPVVPPSRRALLLTPLESQQFDAAHELVGTIVEVLVPFGDRDGAKLRPAVVVGANESELLVRPIYSKPGPTRQPLHSWHRLGLEHESFLDDHRISVAMPSLVRPSVRLNDTEWNATL